MWGQIIPDEFSPNGYIMPEISALLINSFWKIGFFHGAQWKGTLDTCICVYVARNHPRWDLSPIYFVKARYPSCGFVDAVFGFQSFCRRHVAFPSSIFLTLFGFNAGACKVKSLWRTLRFLQRRLLIYLFSSSNPCVSMRRTKYGIWLNYRPRWRSRYSEDKDAIL
jgi:hypothetical protein